MQQLSALSGAVQKSLTVASPGTAEKLPMFFTTVPLTVQALRAIVAGTSPSATYSIRFGPDFSAAGTEVVTGGVACTNSSTGLVTTTLTVAAIPAGSWVWLTTTATSGTVTALHVTIHL